jgi:hypothetical protein
VDLAIGDILQHAHDAKLWSRVTTDFKAEVASLFAELDAAKVQYVLVGGVAMLSYVEGRNTEDIDLIVRSDELERLPFAAVIEDRDFGHGTFHGVRIDLLLTTNPFFEHVAREERTVVQLGDRSIAIASRRGLVLLKLFALPSLNRQGKLARAALYETDVLVLLQGSDVTDESLLAELEPHLAKHDWNETRSILLELRGRRRFTGPAK